MGLEPGGAVSREEALEKAVKSMLDYGMGAGQISQVLKLPLETVMLYQ